MRRLIRIGVVLVALAIAGGAIAVAWLATSESAVAWLAARAVAAAGGTLEITEPRGSLAGTVRMARLRYEDEDFRITAQDVALEPVLIAALARRLELKTLAARELEIVIKPTPAVVDARHARAAARGRDRAGDGRSSRRAQRSGRARLRLGDARLRRLGDAPRDPRPEGRLAARCARGDDRLWRGAAVPGERHGVARARGPEAPGRPQATLSGSLELLEVALGGKAAGADAGGTLRVASFADRWLADANVRLADLDLARLDPSWPRTQLAVEAKGASRDDGAIAGTVDAKNAAAGTFTDGQLPVADLASPFVWRGGELSLTALAAGFGAGGSASGTARAAPGRAALDLEVRRLDLRALHRPLRATRLDGRIAASVTASAQDVRANLAQANVRFELEGTRRGDAFAVKRFVAAAGGGTLTAEGTVGLAGTQAFDARAKLDRFDPSAFGAYPSARINADIAATGALEPRWHADARFDVRDSRWRDARLDGNGRLAASPSEVHDVHASLRVGANRLVAQGGLGRRGDSLAISLAAPRLADLDPRLAGRARVNGTLRGALERPAVELDASAEQLELPGGYRATALTAHGTLSPDDDPRARPRRRRDDGERRPDRARRRIGEGERQLRAPRRGSRGRGRRHRLRRTARRALAPRRRLVGHRRDAGEPRAFPGEARRAGRRRDRTRAHRDRRGGRRARRGAPRRSSACAGSAAGCPRKASSPAWRSLRSSRSPACRPRSPRRWWCAARGRSTLRRG